MALLLCAVWLLWPTEQMKSFLQPPVSTPNGFAFCSEVRPKFGPYQQAVIKEPGLHCVSVDFWQQRLADFAGHTGPTSDSNLISIIANDVTIEMSNHTIHSDGNSNGIVAQRIEQNDRSIPINIVIKNGVLDLRGAGTGVAILDQWSMNNINDQAPKNISGFRKSGIVLENLLIKTDNVGIKLEGDGNIIRNCIIESGGNSAVMLAGPNGKIINNIITLTEPMPPANGESGLLSQFDNLSDFRKNQRAAIALHRATNTVISGNRIQVKGTSRTYHNIYLTDASVSVHISDNTIVGSADIVTSTKRSTADIKSNVVEKHRNKQW
jgi:hypothetical protein